MQTPRRRNPPDLFAPTEPPTLDATVRQLASLHADVSGLVPEIVLALHACEATLAHLLRGLGPRRHPRAPSEAGLDTDARVEELVKQTRNLSSILSEQRELEGRCETLRRALGVGGAKLTDGLYDAYASYRARFDSLSRDLHELTPVEPR